MTELERARSPLTVGDELRALAAGGGELARAVAANPSAPGDLLLSLALEWAEVVVSNPSLPKGITDEATLMALLVPRSCPEQVFWDCIRSLQPDLAWVMSGHKLSAEVMIGLVDAWREMGDWDLWDSGEGMGVLEGLAAQECLPPSLARYFVGDANARGILAQNPACPQEVLEELTRDLDPYTRSDAEKTLAARR